MLSYLQFPVSYRDLERLLADRGVQVDHVTLFRWTQRFAPELERRLRRHLRPCRGPWHVDETKGRVRAAPANDVSAQRTFVHRVFGVAA